MSYVGDRDQQGLFYFPEDIAAAIAPPVKFTFPFFYEPHPLARFAATHLQRFLQEQSELNHNFGLDPTSLEGAIGKMFGVLVVRDKTGRLAYLWAFSGKLAGSNDHPEFVPPVFDMLVEGSFFLRGIELIDAINGELEELESGAHYLDAKAALERILEQATQELASLKGELKDRKDARKCERLAQRDAADTQAYAALEAELVKQSLYDKHRLRTLTEQWNHARTEAEQALAPLERRIDALRTERRERSAALQEQLFEQYGFLNSAGTVKSLKAIFQETAFGKPPSAAGECATPKLLQAAFLRGYEPLAMAEFWWGAPPKSEIRKHGHFYPACTGKCKPILAHMLDGMAVDESPFLQIPEEHRALEIVFEDNDLVVVNKPSGLRSVPGVDVFDSVYSRLKAAMGDAEPLIVHRLDMDTSGLLVVAKTQDAHRHLQKQFLRRTVSKRYTALLSRAIDGIEGEILLPLRPDLYNRPRQLVCTESGKRSVTQWKAIERVGDTTRVHFWPLTGRTHQLRMHAAHELGLAAPIVGDDLYGTAASRLFLHAAHLAFVHPVTKAAMSFDAPEEF